MIQNLLESIRKPRLTSPGLGLSTRNRQEISVISASVAVTHRELSDVAGAAQLPRLAGPHRQALLRGGGT